MAMSARELLASLPIQMAKGGSISEKQKQRILAAEQKFLANPEKFTGAQLYNKMLESGVSVQDMLDAGVKQSTIDQVFTAQGPIPVEQFTGPTTAKSSLADLTAQEREAAIARGTALVNRLQQGGIDPEERRRLQRAATQYGVTFQDMMNAGIDPSILFDVQTATTPKGPLTDSTVYQPGPINPATPGLDTAFRESPVRKRIPGTEEFDPLTGSPTGYRYTPAARLTPATGSGLSWTPPVVTSRPRQLLDVGGGYRPSYSQIYAQNRADQDRALMNAFRESGRPYNFAEYNYWRNRLRANDFGQGKIDEAKFRTEFDKWNSETKAPLTGDGGNPPAGGNPQAGAQNYGTYNYYTIDPVTGMPRYEQADTRIAGGPVTPKDITLGGAYMFAEGGPVKKIEGVAEESATPETESRTMLQRLTGIGEAGLTAGTAMASSIPAGLKGIYDFAATPGSFYDRLKKATETIEGQTMATTYIPRTEAGQEYVQNLSALAAPSEYVRDKTLEQTNNPYMATAAEFVYDPLNFVPGMKTLGAVAPLVAKVPRTASKMLSAIPTPDRPFVGAMDMRIADMGPAPRTKDQARAELSKNARGYEVARLDQALSEIEGDKVTSAELLNALRDKQNPGSYKVNIQQSGMPYQMMDNPFIGAPESIDGQSGIITLNSAEKLNPDYRGQHDFSEDEIAFARFTPVTEGYNRGIYVHELQSDLMDDLRKSGVVKRDSPMTPAQQKELSELTPKIELTESLLRDKGAEVQKSFSEEINILDRANLERSRLINEIVLNPSRYLKKEDMIISPFGIGLGGHGNIEETLRYLETTYPLRRMFNDLAISDDLLAIKSAAIASALADELKPDVVLSQLNAAIDKYSQIVDVLEMSKITDESIWVPYGQSPSAYNGSLGSAQADITNAIRFIKRWKAGLDDTNVDDFHIEGTLDDIDTTVDIVRRSLEEVLDINDGNIAQSIHELMTGNLHPKGQSPVFSDYEKGLIKVEEQIRRTKDLKREQDKLNAELREFVQKQTQIKGEGKLREAFPGMKDNSKASQQLMMKMAVNAAQQMDKKFVAFPGAESAQAQLYVNNIPRNGKDVVKDLGPGYELKKVTLMGKEGPFDTWAITWTDEAKKDTMTKGIRFAEGGPVSKVDQMMEEEMVRPTIPQDNTVQTESRGMLDRLMGISERRELPRDDVPDYAGRAQAMLQGATEIPGTVMGYGKEIMQSEQPVKEVGEDIAFLGEAMYEGLKQDPKGFVLDILPGSGEYRSGQDAQRLAQLALDAELAGDLELAKSYRQQSALAAQGAIPGAGLPSRVARRVSKASDMLNDFDQISTKAKSQVEPRRRTKSGQYIGAPEGVDTPQKLASIVKSMKNLAKEGEYGRFWYERSGRQILDLVGGDVDAADKIIQAIAITSPQTPVANNFEYALQAYNQWKNGEPIKTGTYTGAMSKKLQAMFDAAPDQDVHGVKTGNFYKNLMVEIDPSRVQGATIDLWMMRAFGYKGDAPTAAQYKFAENEIKRIANELGWEPQQVQAAVWVDLKSRMENPDLKKAVEAESVANGWMHYEKVKGKNVRVLDDPERHRALWLERSLAYSPTAEDMTRAKFDYADAAEKNRAQVSWESIPGRTNTHMPEIFDAPYEVINDFHVAMSKAFLDDQGGDIIARRLGMMSPGDFEAPGYFEGRVSPGTQTEIVAPRQFGITARENAIRAQAKEEGWSKEKLAREIGKVQAAAEPAAMDQIAVYAAVRGILMKQDGVGYHRPQYVAGLSAPRANGVQINIGRPLTPNETSAFAEALRKYAGHGAYNPIGDPAGARIINFDYFDEKTQTYRETPNTDFQDIVNKALGDVEFEGGESFNARRFTADTGYSGNNWKEKVNGEGYLDDSRLAGRPDLQQVVRDIVTELAPRIEAVETEFANKYGWTRNPELNSAYLKGEEVTSTMPDSGGTR